MPEVVLSTVEGFHVPVILLLDVVGNVGTVPPLHIVNDVPKLKVGVILGLTVTLNVAVVAHCPASGVNVYVPEAVLLTVEGLHVPVILLLDVIGKVGTVPPLHIVEDVPNANVGVTFGLTVTLNVAVVAH